MEAFTHQTIEEINDTLKIISKEDMIEELLKTFELLKAEIETRDKIDEEIRDYLDTRSIEVERKIYGDTIRIIDNDKLPVVLCNILDKLEMGNEYQVPGIAYFNGFMFNKDK